MSLINDALKRAEESQYSTPREATGTAMKSVPDASPTGKTDIWLPSIGGTLVLGAALIAGIYFLRAAEGETQIRARTEEKPVASRPVPTTPVAAVEQPVSVRISTPVVETATPAPQPEPALAVVVAAAPPEPAQALASPPDTAPAAPAAPAVAKPHDFKLQAIIAHPKRPSAIVNGNTLFIGDSIEGVKLVAVTAGSITLASAEGRQVLRLDK